MSQTLKIGDDNVYVSVAKILSGYEDSTSVFDEKFKEFMEAWQTKHSLTPDGIIGEKSWVELGRDLPTVSRTKNRKCAYVKVVQLLVNVDADGIFGSKTKTAVKSFQSVNNLKDDGIVGQNTWKVLLGLKDDPVNPATFVQPPNFKQGDSRWGKKMYSNHGDKSQTMASSGCGPTSMADIVAQWWDKNITPYDMALKALEWGCRTSNSGTTSSFFKKVANLYKAASYKPSSNINDVINCLNDGGYVIVCFGPGSSGKPGYKKWTKGGHYCCIWGYNNGTFYINDPASSSSARAKGTKEEVMACRKGYYLFRK